MLFENQRWANADQMYGFSAECGLKAIMQGLGMQVDEIGKPTEKEHQQHVQDLWPVFRTFVAGQSGRRYLRLFPADDPFADWSHHDRYAHRDGFSEDAVDAHRSAAEKIRDMVDSSEQDGQS
ncbi:MAG: hypothetical protein F4057_00715 [Acidobacteria bacterium]|nr:hypothetical protein [Acidobacteriota bacterium]